MLVLGLLFGALAFLQGIADPTGGLLYQPIMSLLRRRGVGDGGVAQFFVILSLPWVLKPLFGFLSDACPLFGSRRRSYLIASALVAGLGFLGGVTRVGEPKQIASLLGWLFLATLGVACSDVVTDALMIEEGQPRGMTGRLQSIQWASSYAATIATGFLGGELSQRRPNPSDC